MTDRELMQQAMDALEDACGGRCNAENNPCWQRDIGNALRDRLAQQEQEPVAWITKGGKGDLWWHRSVDDNGNDNLDDVPLYMAPPLRSWVGLTDEERTNLWREFTGWGDPSFDDNNLMKAIEAKLRSENT